MAFHSFAAIIVLPAGAPLSARALSASVRLEQSVVKLLVYAICHEIDKEGEGETDIDTHTHTHTHTLEEGGGVGVGGKEEKREDGQVETETETHTHTQEGEEEEEEEEEDEDGTLAATTRFGSPRRREVGGYMIEYITLRFISVTRRME
jgi:hypothetical protein